jgi:hypothetical protein
MIVVGSSLVLHNRMELGIIYLLVPQKQSPVLRPLMVKINQMNPGLER